MDELYSKSMAYDIFITGSDQVWNPQSLRSSPEPYFLTFAPNETKKVSYAASFGISSIPESIKHQYNSWLTNIDCLSVREHSGHEIIKDISGRDSKVVLDPTLLLSPESWEKVLVEPKLKKPYILLYVRMYSPYVTKLAYYLSRLTGYNIVRIARKKLSRRI